MSVEVVEKKKAGKVCGDCDHSLTSDEVAKSDSTCPSCGSENIKKSLVIVRKAVGDEEDDLESTDGVVVDEVDDDDEDEGDEDELSDEVEDEDDADEDDEDEEDDEEVEDEAPALAAVGKSLRNLEVFNILTACAEDIVKSLDSGDSSEYEETMTEVNNVLDAAVEKWQKGRTITKSADAAGHAKLIRDRVNGYIGKEKTVPTKVKKSDEPVTSAITKREDLPEDVQKSLNEADQIIEKSKVDHWNEVAKSLSHLGLDGPTLRKLHEADPEAFETLKKSLDTAQGQLKESAVLKSWGNPGGGEDSDVTKVDQTKAAEIAKAEGITIEQAQVRLMGAQTYQPTNV